jgi:F-type H+/Na+-transporting ATPase subunit alpha
MANIKADEISKILREQIENYEQTVAVDEVGSIISVGDGIARIHGLDKVMAGEMLAFPHDIYGIALNLEEEQVGAVLLGETTELKEGDTVKRTNTIMSVPVGDALIGRVVNPLGEPVDDKGPISAKERNPLERIAPGVLDRQPVREPLQTGIKAIDSMIPIGRGQRELIIGDRQTGKTAIILDTIINQKGGDVICIYCAIGQKRWTTRSSSRLRRRSRLRCNTSLPMRRVRWANISATTNGTRSPFMMIFPSMRRRTARFRCCCGVRLAARLIPVTFSICTRACWSAPPN